MVISALDTCLLTLQGYRRSGADWLLPHLPRSRAERSTLRSSSFQQELTYLRRHATSCADTEPAVLFLDSKLKTGLKEVKEPVANSTNPGIHTLRDFPWRHIGWESFQTCVCETRCAIVIRGHGEEIYGAGRDLEPPQKEATSRLKRGVTSGILLYGDRSCVGSLISDMPVSCPMRA